ncbi:MAG TPA: VOC family protein [Puia sp.]|nr:VOC family protein [Puia sp.]
MPTTPSRMHKVSPNIYVDDIHATIAFYRNLGFDLLTQVGEGPDMIFALMTCGDINFMFQTFKSIEGQLPQVNRTNGGSLLLYIDMSGIREFYGQLEGRVPIVRHLELTFYGATEFSIEDNNHYLLTFAENEQP